MGSILRRQTRRLNVLLSVYPDFILVPMTKQTTTEIQVEKILYRPREAAVATGTSASWIYARLADGSLTAVRLAGRTVRIRKEDLLRFCQCQQIELR